MKLFEIVVISLMGTSILGCSSDSTLPTSDDLEQVTATPSTSEDRLPDPNAVYDTTAELLVANSFLIEQEYALDISFKNRESRRAYLSVCAEFTNDSKKGIQVNYDSCFLRTSIESDFAGSLSIPNHQHKLVMAVWYLDDDKKPSYHIWENNNDAEGLKTFNVD